MINLPEDFGCMVFGDSVMRERLPQDKYTEFRRAVAYGIPLDRDVANVVAAAMKDWAIEKGATHYTHWFQPMTGITAEKHDSFISPDGNGGIIMDFSGKELIKGEPDASSFPSGGLRATFEARGYTAWDPTSYAFIKGSTLCIPTAFCSYGGHALDKKTPLLRSMDAINQQALRLLHLIGNTDVKKVTVTVGAEQEYFLIDKAVYEKRPDLMLCGRTLFGARPPKGQEMDDHYFGAIKPRVLEFMKELDCELWKLGVMAKTEHNEAAPAQHELAPIYSTTNIATDHNQLTMELMRLIASKHQLACLLNEKPFEGVNGSGKHNNWSISTDTGDNLLYPGKTPSQNTRFLLFLCAILKAVDEHQDLLRVSVASAANDHRLGASEAPPAIVSVFLGDELTEVLEAIEHGEVHLDKVKTQMETGAAVLPHFSKDVTDRNRTSPFAFTGNKFEFRMPGSSLSVAGPNIILNTIVADVLSGFCERLESTDDTDLEVKNIIRDCVAAHKRIIFNGNNYSPEWVAEAERRGLLNLRTTVDALPCLISPENIKLFARNNVFSREELESRFEIYTENYIKTINIEALTLIDMIKKSVIPAVLAYENDIASLIEKKQTINKVNSQNVSVKTEMKLMEKLSLLSDSLSDRLEELENALVGGKKFSSTYENAEYYRDTVISIMTGLRAITDELESIVGAEYWPFPTYSEMLYSVK